MSSNVERFRNLFHGLDSSYGTGKGGWVHKDLTLDDYADHLDGRGSGLGIAPLLPDATVKFAAIDLDEPDFDAAREMQLYIPGTSFIEKSRSGNAHVWVFFEKPVNAWVPRGLLREATAGAGKRFVEIFPKQDKLRIGMVGNYINLPYFGDSRHILVPDSDENLSLGEFLDAAEESLNTGPEWEKRARWMQIPSPEERESEGREFGTQSVLHICCEYVLENRETNPVAEGHRAVVYFALSKQLANCNQYTADEALMLLGLINDASTDPISEQELKRIYFNAERGEFTSTGCDDPLFGPYSHPDCKIANR